MKGYLQFFGINITLLGFIVAGALFFYSINSPVYDAFFYVASVYCSLLLLLFGVLSFDFFLKNRKTNSVKFLKKENERLKKNNDLFLEKKEQLENEIVEKHNELIECIDELEVTKRKNELAEEKIIQFETELYDAKKELGENVGVIENVSEGGKL
jgi:septal ring factor EnvC (AmiA/AmiB activator)